MKKLFINQGYHLLGYVVIGLSLWGISSNATQSQNRMMGMTAHHWVLFSWIFAAIFQAWVFLFWRLELYYGKVSQWTGNFGFTIFRIGFVLLGGCRFLPLIPISKLSANTLEISSWVTHFFIITSTPFILKPDMKKIYGKST